MSVVLPFVGVLAGVAISSAYSFWAVRRSELERAVVAGYVMDDELCGLRDALLSSPGTADPTAATDAWREHRRALVVYLTREEFQRVGAALRRAQACAAMAGRPVDEARVADELEHARAMLATHAIRLRAEHQAFILTPLWKYLARQPWRRRARLA